MALRRLRAFVREGALTELDIEATIDETAQQRRRARDHPAPPSAAPNVKVLLLLDVGGSMDPHVEVCERLFSAAKRATHWKRLEHATTSTTASTATSIRRRGCATASRSRSCSQSATPPGRLHHGRRRAHAPVGAVAGRRLLGGQDFGTTCRASAWMDLVARHFRKTAWLNPEPESYLAGTAETLRRLFPMFRLSLDGLTQGAVATPDARSETLMPRIAILVARRHHLSGDPAT